LPSVIAALIPFHFIFVFRPAVLRHSNVHAGKWVLFVEET